MVIIKLNNQVDGIVKLLVRSQEKQSIEEGGGSHQHNQLPNRARGEKGNFMMSNQPRSTIWDIHCNVDMESIADFEQD